MKKILIFILFLIFITGCHAKEEVGMIMEKSEHSMISIHYPITHIKKIDKKVKNYVEEVYSNFQENYVSGDTLQPELNIDYTYDFYSERYFVITLFTYINDYSFDTATTDVFSLVYDSSSKKFLTLLDVVSPNDWTILLEKTKIKLMKDYENELNEQKLDEFLGDFPVKNVYFSIHPNDLTLYFLGSQISDFDDRFFAISFSSSEIPFTLQLESSVAINYEEILETESSIDPTHPVVALTFDDGPTSYTEKILDILKQEEAVATFFVLGNKVEMYPDVIRRIVEEGSEIGNHSYNHKWLSRLSVNEIKWQVDKTQEEIFSITGKYPRYLRPTYGSINKRIYTATSLNVVLWTIDPKDWKSKSSKEIAKDVYEVVEDEDIVLMHDNHKRTIDAVSILIPKLKELGYQFVTLSELEEVKKLREFY